MANQTFDTEEPVEVELPTVQVLAAEPLSTSRRAFAFSELESMIATASVLIASPKDTITHIVDGTPISLSLIHI